MTREEYRAQKAARERMRQMEQKHKQAARGSMDLPFLILTVLLTVVGLIMLFSASFPRAYYDTGDGTYYFKRQALFAAVGMAAMFVIAKINYQRWRGASRMLVGLALFLLILVIIPHNPLAITANNATRWLGIKGVFQFQPSEIAKLAVIVYFADTISKKKEKMLTWRQGILPYVALLGVISVLMMLEPHLSGTVLILCTGAVLMIVGGIQGWLVGAGVGGVAALGFLFIRLAEKGIIKYGAARIAMWHDPWLDYSGDGYQLAQSLITIGSRGPRGGGLGRRGGGRGLRPQPPEVPVPAGAVQRLHFLRGVRGAGAYRRLRHHADLRPADPAGLLDRPPRPRPVRRAADGGHHDPFGLADVSEHRGGVGLCAHHRHLPALLQLRRHGAVPAAGGDGHRTQCVAADTRAKGGGRGSGAAPGKI